MGVFCLMGGWGWGWGRGSILLYRLRGGDSGAGAGVVGESHFHGGVAFLAAMGGKYMLAAVGSTVDSWRTLIGTLIVRAEAEV